MISTVGVQPAIVGRSDGQADEIPLRHFAVLLPERQVQPDEPGIASPPARIRAQGLAIGARRSKRSIPRCG